MRERKNAFEKLIDDMENVTEDIKEIPVFASRKKERAALNVANEALLARAKRFRKALKKEDAEAD